MTRVRKVADDIDVRIIRSLYTHVFLSVSYPLSFSRTRADIRNKHIMIDLGTGNNNKMYVYLNGAARELGLINSNWAMGDKQEVSSHAPWCRVELISR